MNRLRRAAVIAFVTHLIAGVAMAAILSRGLETNQDFPSRLAFIVNHRVLWTFGWLTWTVAALAILYFYDAFATTHKVERFAVLLTAAAIVADISAQTMEIGILPGIALRVMRADAGSDLFMLLHRIDVLLSGVVANTFYSLSALILTWATRRVYPRSVSAAGFTVTIFGLSLSVAALMDSSSGMFWTNVVLLPAILAWLALIVVSYDGLRATARM